MTGPAIALHFAAVIFAAYWHAHREPDPFTIYRRGKGRDA